ncbi:MAG: response regulator [Rhizobacter sp.]|nr:response regulator [Chlorobiales bacterium]
MTVASVDLKKHVLIVDDEENIAIGILKTLSQKGYLPVHANSAEQAIEFLGKSPFDLVITDLKMPGMSGLDLLKHVRSTYPNTGVIMMTAYGSTEVQNDASKRGSLFYIEKPFDFEHLQNIIAEFFDKQGKAKGASENELGEDIQGVLPGLQIMDVVQMNCLSRVTCTLHIKSDGTKEGIICFNKGDITHAETNTRSGKEAFLEIASWKGGSFETLDQVPPTVTIVDGWEQLLIESLEVTGDAEPAAKPKPRRAVVPEKIEPAPDDTSKMPDRVMEAASADAVFIITHSGFAIDKRLKVSEIDISKSGDEISHLLPSIFGLGKALGTGDFSEMSLRYKDKIVMVRNVAENELLFIVVAPSSVASGDIYKAIQRESENLKKLL